MAEYKNYKEYAIDISQVDIPNPLYKYRTWHDKYHKTILTRLEVFMSPPSLFDDKKDCRIYRKLDYTDEEIFNIYFKWIKRENPHLHPKEISLQSIVWTQNAPLKDEEYLEAFKLNEFEQLDSMVGVLSVTEFNNQLPMWNEYADHGNGFCVGFHSNELIKMIRSVGKVHYTDSLPQVMLGEPFGIQTWKTMFNKERTWEFEQEYRFRIFNINRLQTKDRIIRLPRECYREIIFGWNMPEVDRKEVINVCIANQLTVKFFAASLIDGIVAVDEYLG